MMGAMEKELAENTKNVSDEARSKMTHSLDKTAPSAIEESKSENDPPVRQGTTQSTRPTTSQESAQQNQNPATKPAAPDAAGKTTEKSGAV